MSTTRTGPRAAPIPPPARLSARSTDEYASAEGHANPSHMANVVEHNSVYVHAQAKRSGAVPTRFTTATDAPLQAPNDQAQVVCPKDFWLTRTASKILQPAWMVSWLTICGLCTALLGFFCGGSDQLFEECSPYPQVSPLEIIGWGLSGTVFVSINGVLPSLRRVAASGGTLEELGAGTQMISVGAGGWNLNRWATFCTGMAFFAFAIVGIGIIALHNGVFQGVLAGRKLLALHEFFAMFVYAVTGALSVALYLTLKIGSALGTSKVQAVRRNVERFDPQSPEWETEVERGVLELVTYVLPKLSEGWSGAAAAVVAVAWAFAIAYVCWALSRDTTALMIVYLCEASLGALCPTIVLYDLAYTSTECDLLVVALNDKRIADNSDANHIKIQKLEVMINQLNKGQG